MYCSNCGKEIPYDAKYCSFCGKQIQKTKPLADEKNMLLALLLSFFLISAGIYYAGNKKKAVKLFIIPFISGYLIKNLVMTLKPIVIIIAMVTWAYALYETYVEVKIANGESNPNLFGDMKKLSNPENTDSVVLIMVIIIFVIVSSMGSLIMLNGGI